MLNVNCHLHTPYSFSAFKDIDEALDRAVEENVKVVGINDFYTAEGYGEWSEGCIKRGLYPLFGIEFISLNEDDQKSGIRVNDPANPGRTYISGKGMSFPFKLDEPYASQLSSVQTESNRQVEDMHAKLNNYLQEKNIGFDIDLNRIKNELTSGFIRERHLAKALRLKLFEFCVNDLVRVASLLERLFDGKGVKSDLDNTSGLENEIRNNLLKTGGAAFVPEKPDAFLPMEDVQRIIIAGGGIPTYPFLADNINGEYTDFEANLEEAAMKLKERGFHSVEFITTRNDVNLLERYAGYLYDEGFIVTFGSEHNSPVMEPVELFARNGNSLTDRLRKINYEGACVIAAHQHVVSQGLQGYIDDNGYADRNKLTDFVKLGDELIKSV